MNNDEKLIELVKAHRAIYDKTDVFYSNKDYVKELWQEIAKDMNQTVPVCQKRWRYLRDYFVRQLHMTQNQNVQQQQQLLQENGTNDNSMITSSSLSSTGISEKISTIETSYNLTVTPTTKNNVTSNNNVIQNNNNNNNNNKKKTYWAFYDKMLFLKPFSSTRKSKPKNDERNININRRQSQGHINNKMITSIGNNTLSEIHTVSDSNSADDEFDSFDYMQMYQMQFGTDIDKAELQCNGASYHTATTITTTNIDDFQQQNQFNQQQQQLQQLQNSINEQNQQYTNYDTTTTINKDNIQELHQQVPQNQQKSMKLVYNNNNKLKSNNIRRRRPSMPQAKKNNFNVAELASTSTLMSSSPMKRKLQQQQQKTTNIIKMLHSSNPTKISEKSSLVIDDKDKQQQSSLPMKKRKRSEICEEILDILKKNSDLDDNDEHSMFFKSLLNSVRKIDEEHILSFRTEIIQIIMKYRYISQQNDKNSCCNSNSSSSSNNSDVVVVDTGEMHWRHKLPC